MKCGNCKDDHGTVQQVKDCYGSRIGAGNDGTGNMFSATKPQMDYIGRLLKERDMTPLPKSAALGKHEASEMIDDLKKIRPSDRTQHQSADGDPEGYGERPVVDRDVLFTDGEHFTISRISPAPITNLVPESDPRSVFHTSPQAANWGIPAGHYAISSLTGNNDLDFYRVDRPEEGRWKGYTFVKMVVGGKPRIPVRGRQRLYEILCAIQKDPESAAQKYGQEIGRCYRCNRELTDKTSRSLGIGPDCRSRDAA